MHKYENERFTGERALYGIKDSIIENSIFDDGESPLKEVNNVEIFNSEFKWKYPLWYSKNVKVTNCKFEVMSRSGIWYTENLLIDKCTSVTPKTFRRCKNLKVFNSSFKNAAESMWECEDVYIKDSYFEGDYLLKNARNVIIENLELNGNYVCDGAKHVLVKNSILNARDAFWNCEDVVVIDSIINSEYIAWNSKNIKFINCKIDSIQPFCYVENLILENCKMFNANLSFERSTVKGNVLNKIDSIKNPYEIELFCKGYDELILEEGIVNKDKIKIFIEEN